MSVAVRTGLAVAGVSLVAVVATTLTPTTGDSHGSPKPAGHSVRPLLPDLDQATPRQISITVYRRGDQRRVLLAFESAAGNIGSGPLLVQGRRRGARRVMSAVQRIKLSDGSLAIRRRVGVLRYAKAPDHEHWHYLAAMRYELRTARGNRSVGRDRKAGFCLGDRYDTNPLRRLPGEPPAGVWVGRCGLNKPGLRSVNEGISVGYSDNYRPTLEGQFIDITGLGPGRYVLVNRVNPQHLLREESYANNAASVLLRIGGGTAPKPRTLRKCPASARCSGGR